MRLVLLPTIALFTSPVAAQPDVTLLGFEDCASQRKLADKGRAEARAIGEHVRRPKIAVCEVLASPFCRTTETASLAFGKGRATNDVRGTLPCRG